MTKDQVLDEVRRIFVDKLRSVLLGPKDGFERIKRNYTRWLIIPLIAAIGAPTIVSLFLSSMQILAVNSQIVDMRLVMQAANDLIPVILCALTTLLMLLGSNLLYRRHVDKNILATAELQRIVEHEIAERERIAAQKEREEAEYKKKIDELLKYKSMLEKYQYNGDREKSSVVAKIILSGYRGIALSEPELMDLIINALAHDKTSSEISLQIDKLMRNSGESSSLSGIFLPKPNP